MVTLYNSYPNMGHLNAQTYSVDGTLHYKEVRQNQEISYFVWIMNATAAYFVLREFPHKRFNTIFLDYFINDRTKDLTSFSFFIL